MNRLRSAYPAWITLFACCLTTSSLKAADDANLISDPGFENASSLPPTYSLFIAPESMDKNCRFTMTSDTFHSGKQSALLQADDFARFAIGGRAGFPITAGDCYRIGVWIKAGADFLMQEGSPGLAMRVNLTTGNPPVPAAVPFLFIYPNNTVSQAGPPGFAPLNTTATVATEWTHMEAVVKLPEGVDFIAPELFFWRAKGSLFIDDFTCQKVDSTTPVTPLVKDTP